MAKIIEIKQVTPAVYLTWVINNICTNACSYCHPSLHTGTNHNYDWADAEKFIKQVLEKYSKIHVAISGGEPTLSPWFRDLVKMFSDAGHPIGVTSNGARTASYYRDISKYLSYIVMSYHPSYEDDNFIEKALACAENTHCTVSVMMDSRHLDKCLNMYVKLADYKQLSIQPIKIHDWGTKNSFGRDYSPEQLTMIAGLPRIHARTPTRPAVEGYTGSTAFYDDDAESTLDAQQLINENNTNFFGWECNIGLESLYVKFDGIVRSGNCITSPILGKIQDSDNILWPTQSIICKQKFCNCTTDVYISKKKV